MNSQDSRYWRLLPEEYIVGKTWIIRKTMKKVFITGINILLAVFLIACASSDSKRLEQALLFAGDNRGELEKVLSHYENNPEKLEAARFLIRNMPRWYGYEGWQLDSIKPVLIQKDKGEAVPKEVITKWQRVSFYSLPKVYDARMTTARLRSGKEGSVRKNYRIPDSGSTDTFSTHRRQGRYSRSGNQP